MMESLTRQAGGPTFGPGMMRSRVAANSAHVWRWRWRRRRPHGRKRPRHASLPIESRLRVTQTYCQTRCILPFHFTVRAQKQCSKRRHPPRCLFRPSNLVPLRFTYPVGVQPWAWAQKGWEGASFRRAQSLHAVGSEKGRGILASGWKHPTQEKPQG